MKPDMKTLFAALIACSFSVTGCDIVGDMTVNDIIAAAEEAARQNGEEQAPDGSEDAEPDPLFPGDLDEENEGEDPFDEGDEADIEPPIEGDDDADDEGPFEDDEPPFEGEDPIGDDEALFEDDEPPFEGENPLDDDECESIFQACIEGFDELDDMGPEDDAPPAIPGDEEDVHLPEDEALFDEEGLDDDPLAICHEMLEACKSSDEEQEEHWEDQACEMALDEAMVCGESLDECLDAVDANPEPGEDPIRPEDDGEVDPEDGLVAPHADPFDACFEALDACEAEIIGDACGHFEEEAPLMVCEADFEACAENAANENEIEDCEQAFEVCVEEQWGPEGPMHVCDEDLNACLDAVPGIDGEAEVEADEGLIDGCFEAHMVCLGEGDVVEGEDVLPPVHPADAVE